MTRARELADPRWTEGVCGDGAVILRDGVMVRITELLKILNNHEAALSRERAEAIEAAAKECDDARAVNSRVLKRSGSLTQHEILRLEGAEGEAADLATNIRALSPSTEPGLPVKVIREWLVIDDSRKNAIFSPAETQKPKGYIPRDVAERLLGRDLGGTVWFSKEEGIAMRAHPEWETELPEPTTAPTEPGPEVALTTVARSLLGRWDEYRGSDANQEQAYYKLAKYAYSDWEALRAALALASGARNET